MGSADVGNVLTGTGADKYKSKPASVADITTLVNATAKPIVGPVTNNVPVGNVFVLKITTASIYLIKCTIIYRLNPANPASNGDSSGAIYSDKRKRITLK